MKVITYGEIHFGGTKVIIRAWKMQGFRGNATKDLLVALAKKLLKMIILHILLN